MKHHGPIAGIAAHGGHIATAGYDNQLILWDRTRRRSLARSLHDHLINNCAFNSDGTMLVTASSDYSARIWDVPSLRLRTVLAGHGDDVDMAVFSPDDRQVATCALDRILRVFDLAGHCLQMFRGHTGNILSVAWTRDGRRLVSSSVDGTVREWDVETGEQLRCNDIDGIRTDTFAMDEAGRIFVGDDEGRLGIIIDGEATYLQAHQAGVKKIVLDESAGVLVSLSYDRTLAVWRLAGPRELTEIARSDLPSLVWARAATLIEGTSLVAVGTFGSRYGVFDWKSGAWDMSDIEPDRSINAVAVMGPSRFAIGDSGVLLQDGFPAAALGSLCNFLLPAGPLLLTGGQLGQLFDARSGQVLYQHHSPLNCGTVFMRQGRRHVAIGSYTGEALIFDAEHDALQLVTILKIYGNAIKGMSSSADRLFSVCASTAVAWHALDDFSLIRMIPRAHDKIANGCCLAGPGGFASVGRDLKLRIWDGDREEVYQTPHPNSVKCICASDDRNTIMTGAYTGTLAGFDMASRSWRSFERPTAAGISSLAYDHRTRHFLAGSYDGRIYAVA